MLYYIIRNKFWSQASEINMVQVFTGELYQLECTLRSHVTVCSMHVYRLAQSVGRRYKVVWQGSGQI